MKMRKKSGLVLLGCLALTLFLGIGRLFYVEYVVDAEENAKRKELRIKQNSECPEEYSEFCDRSGFKWSRMYQEAYTEGNIEELWVADSLGKEYLKTIYISSSEGFTDEQRKQAEAQWNRIRENYGVKAKEIEESTGINKHVGK